MRLQSHLNRQSKSRAVLLELFVYFLYHIVCLDAELGIYSEDGIEIGKDDFPDYHRFKIGTILESNSIDEGKWLLVKTGFKLCKNYPKLLRKILKLSMSKVILGDSMNFSRRLYPFAYNKNLQTIEDKNLTQTMIANINESNAQGFGKATTNELHMLLNQNIYFNPQNIKQPVVFYTSNGKSINKIVKQSMPNAQVRTEKNNSIFVVYHRWKDIVTCAIENTK